MSDGKYTKVGTALFAWEPYLSVRRESADAAHLWLALYASAPAKLMIPGLWMGGVGTMADASRLTFHECVHALDLLCERAMVEFDPKTQLLRLTALPDKCEAAPNQACLRGWWSRRQGLPDCGVRDRHVDLMAWLTLPIRPSKRSTGLEMQRAWDDTWGQALHARTGSSLPASPSLVLDSAKPKQLNLLSTTPNRDGGGDRQGDGGGDRPEEVEVMVEERGRGAGEGDPDHRLWAAVLAEAATSISVQNFDMWLAPLQCQREASELRVIAPTDYHLQWVKTHYLRQLQAAVDQQAPGLRIAI